MSNLLFQDRAEAGQLLAGRLQYLANRPDVLVLALSRGSMPVAAEVARELRAPLDLFLARPVGIPQHPELPIGSVVSGGVLVANQKILSLLDVSEETINNVAGSEGRELERMENSCRGERPPVDPRDKILVLVDDGRAAEGTLRAAVLALRQKEPSGIILAMPVAAPEICSEMQNAAEQVVCIENQEPQYAIGLYYRHFPEVTDEEVGELLQQSEEDLQ
jgi:putative phosphoribosyl transferase